LCKVLHFVQDDSAKNLTINGSLLAIMKRTALLTSCLLLLTLTDLNADNISVLGSKPRWSVLEHYQETITHDEFADLINDVYCTHGFAPDLVEINEKTARRRNFSLCDLRRIPRLRDANRCRDCGDPRKYCRQRNRRRHFSV